MRWRSKEGLQPDSVDLEGEEAWKVCKMIKGDKEQRLKNSLTRFAELSSVEMASLRCPGNIEHHRASSSIITRTGMMGT